jgi:membrane protein DedA with SNARE-associated domain
MVAAAAFGSLAGDTVSYTIGRRWGRELIDRFTVTRRRLGPLVDRADRYFAVHGGRAVFFGRWVGALRAVVPFVAGLGHLRFRSFLAWNVAASVLWAAVTIAVGAGFGRGMASTVDRLGTWVSAAVVLVAVGWLLRRAKRRRQPHEQHSRV